MIVELIVIAQKKTQNSRSELKMREIVLIGEPHVENVHQEGCVYLKNFHF